MSISARERDPATCEAPTWTRAVDRVLLVAARSVRLLGAVTPSNAARERARLVAAFASGHESQPRWEYAPPTEPPAGEQLARARAELARAERSPLAEAYAARIEELALEAQIAAAAGTRALTALARRRFGGSDASSSDRASRWARAWIHEPRTPSADAVRSPSDADRPGSLLATMRAEVGRRRLPFSVVVHEGLAALAATGDRAILVAKGRLLSSEDIARTVLHEIDGHAVPRVRASRQPVGLFAIATAAGAEEQEGYALLLEERAGFLRGARKRQLALRHLAAQAMNDGATFVECVRGLVGTHRASPDDAVAVAERAFRGSDGTSAGLGRERAYLESFARVEALIARAPDDLRVLASGQVAVSAVDVLRPYFVDSG